jgi:hypothetical protein
VAIHVAESLRRRIDEADQRRCRYCLTAEANSGIRLTYDHITPVSKGGETTFENVCLACSACNEHKSDATHAVDPISGETVPLFNPRGLASAGEGMTGARPVGRSAQARYGMTVLASIPPSSPRRGALDLPTPTTA